MMFDSPANRFLYEEVKSRHGEMIVMKLLT